MSRCNKRCAVGYVRVGCVNHSSHPWRRVLLMRDISDLEYHHTKQRQSPIHLRFWNERAFDTDRPCSITVLPWGKTLFRRVLYQRQNKSRVNTRDILGRIFPLAEQPGDLAKNRCQRPHLSSRSSNNSITPLNSS